MKKNLLILSVIILCSVNLYAQNFNLNLLGTRPYPSGDLSNISGWVSTAGTEYALVGWEQGLSIVDVSNPANPIQVFNVPGQQSIWREVKTFDHYAYVTTEAGGGLQIVDLSSLPAAPNYHDYTGDGAIFNQLDNIHSLHIEQGYVYLHGSNLFNGAAVICDLNADPWNPVYVGHTPGTYVHDGFALGNKYYSCHIYDGYFSIFDVTNKANPVLLNQQTTPGNFTHNSWCSTDSNFLFTTDEVSNSYLTSYDVTNPLNIQELDRIQITPGSGSIIHNTHIVNKNGGDFAVTSWYTDGVVITDVTRPANMVNVGRYDTYTQGGGGGFNGDWGVYPFLPSGNIIASDINNGLFVLGPTYVRACYLEGTVTDSITGLPLNTANVEILSTSIIKQTKITGEYKTGFATPGTYDIKVSKPGYITKTIYGITLASGIVTVLDVELVPSVPFAFSGQVLEQGTNLPISGASVHFQSAQYSVDAVTNGSGNFTVSTFYTDTYDAAAGDWGHITSCTNGISISAATGAVTFYLDKGWYDDFSFDFGWTNTNATNDWERGEPMGTTSNNLQANPEFDVTNDCLDQAYVTGNNGGSATDNDVDPQDGIVILTSPSFDLTSYTNPQLNYSRWFFNGFLNGNNPNDSMWVTISNGLTTVKLETMTPNTSGNGTWVDTTWLISNYITPTSNMHISVRTLDNMPGNVVEGGFDKFEIVEAVGINEIKPGAVAISALPNPFSNEINIVYIFNGTDAVLNITDITGKTVEQAMIKNPKGTIAAAKNLKAGIYFIQVLVNNKLSDVIKVVKQ